MRMARRADSGESFGLEIGLPQEAIAAAKKAAEDIEVVARRPRRTMTTQPVASGAVGGPSEAFATAIPTPMGEATVAEGVLDGQEVDEHAVQVGNMLKQVVHMVEEDAESMGALVERWVQHKG
jgi:hypothetical protein